MLRAAWLKTLNQERVYVSVYENNVTLCFSPVQ